MSLLFEVMIPGRVRIKKNGRQYIGRGKNIPSKRYAEWEKMASAYVLTMFSRFRLNLPIRERVRAEFEFHFKNFKNEPDTSNCVEGPQDLLQKMRVIENDKLVVEFSAKKIIGTTDCVMIRLFRIDARAPRNCSRRAQNQSQN